mgnify:CR=1 FL=1
MKICQKLTEKKKLFRQGEGGGGDARVREYRMRGGKGVLCFFGYRPFRQEYVIENECILPGPTAFGAKS